jgi:hypothetical protein
MHQGLTWPCADACSAPHTTQECSSCNDPQRWALSTHQNRGNGTTLLIWHRGTERCRSQEGICWHSSMVLLGVARTSTSVSVSPETLVLLRVQLSHLEQLGSHKLPHAARRPRHKHCGTRLLPRNVRFPFRAPGLRVETRSPCCKLGGQTNNNEAATYRSSGCYFSQSAG